MVWAGSTGVRLVLALALWLVAAAATCAQGGAPGLAGQARLTGPGTAEAGRASFTVELPLSQPVPWRARLWADPPRAALDFRSLDFAGLGLRPAGAATAIRTGDAGGGWSRLVVEFDRPMGFAVLGMAVDPASGQARLTARLVPVDPAEFDRQRAALDRDEATPAVVGAPPPAARDLLRPLRVVLDPGHGGLDPGAVHGNLTEAALMLTFARELAEALRRSGGFEVVLTRDGDEFVSLESRVRIAREAGAEVFLSLHADALDDGEASGATLYTLAEQATDAAAAALAERHDRANLLGGGADLTGIEDEVALVLIDIARTETRPRTERLVAALLGAIREADLRLHRRPWQEAAFSVLKAPDIPSVLIEVGFLSSPRDRARLADPAWRGRMAAALVAGLAAWRDDEAGRRLLVRQ